MELLIMRLSAASHVFIPLRSKYSPEHPVLKTVNLCSSLFVRDQVSQTHNKIKDNKIFNHDP
jgi:hypothetical protein